LKRLNFLYRSQEIVAFGHRRHCPASPASTSHSGKEKNKVSQELLDIV